MANRRNSPLDAMLIATNHGSVMTASPIKPFRQYSRFHADVRQPQHQARMNDAATSAGATGPLTRIPRLMNNQKRPASVRDGRFPSSQRQNWHAKMRKARVASVVASFDSATAIGAVARINPARPP